MKSHDKHDEDRVTFNRFDNPRAGTSKEMDTDFEDTEGEEEDRSLVDPIKEVELKVEKRIRDAERAKARIYDVSGKKCSAILDEDFMLVGAEISDALKTKIIEGKYANFAKLISRDKIMEDETERYQMCVKGGQQYWEPFEDKERLSINSIDRWDQAFRIYSKIYLIHHPQRAAELVEYAHIIHHIASMFI